VPVPDRERTALARAPRRTAATWGVRAPLVAWLRAEAERAAADLGRYRVLDVGCGYRPYEALFSPHAAGYVGVDLDNPAADLQGTAESLPVEDGSFEIVLCNQVLEHANDPAAAVRELRRVLAPGGRVLASTHGTAVYHPAPNDFWRWTHTGLEQLFTRNGDWRSVAVRPGAGTAACLAGLLATYVDLVAQRVHARPLGYPAIWLLNGGGALVDRLSRQLREPVPGTIFANYHVVAEAPAA
jgi:SAM-dependent methyltransferase